MEIKNADKAQVLVEALPYLQKYYNKVVVVKYGGNAMVNPQLKEAVMSDIVLLSLVGIKVVLVHGGGPEITQTLSSMGKESKFIGGLRCTDEETIKVVQMVLCGKTNKDLVRLLQQNNGRAIGMCGVGQRRSVLFDLCGKGKRSTCVDPTGNCIRRNDPQGKLLCRSGAPRGKTGVYY